MLSGNTISEVPTGEGLEARHKVENAEQQVVALWGISVQRNNIKGSIGSNEEKLQTAATNINRLYRLKNF